MNCIVNGVRHCLVLILSHRMEMLDTSSHYENKITSPRMNHVAAALCVQPNLRDFFTFAYSSYSKLFFSISSNLKARAAIVTSNIVQACCFEISKYNDAINFQGIYVKCLLNEVVHNRIFKYFESLLRFIYNTIANNCAFYYVHNIYA